MNMTSASELYSKVCVNDDIRGVGIYNRKTTFALFEVCFYSELPGILNIIIYI